jgi:hypothetical protein
MKVSWMHPIRLFYCFPFSLILYLQPAAAQAPPATAEPTALTIEKSVPLRIDLERRVLIRRAGTPIQGRLAQPVYAFDRLEIPAGAEVSGQVIQVDKVSGRKRFRAILGGDFTPLREAKVRFDSIHLQNGTVIPIETIATLGSPAVLKFQSARPKPTNKQRAAETGASGRNGGKKVAVSSAVDFRRNAI